MPGLCVPILLDSGYRRSRDVLHGSGFGLRVSGCRLPGSGFSVSVFGFRVSVSGFRVLSFGLQVLGFRSQVSDVGRLKREISTRDITDFISNKVF